MKKISSVVVVVVFCMQTLSAQYETRPRLVEASFFGGPTVMWASPKTKSYKNEGARIGGVYGVGVDINMVQPLQNYYFSTGLHARHIRSAMSFKDNYHIAHTDSILNDKFVRSGYNMIYVSIPTAIKLKTDPIGSFIIFGVVGMDNSFCVSSKRSDDIENQSNYGKIDMYQHTLFFREALLASVGFEFIIKGNTKASFELAFNNGFTNIFKKKYINNLTKDPVVANTRGFEFQFGFVF